MHAHTATRTYMHARKHVHTHTNMHTHANTLTFNRCCRVEMEGLREKDRQEDGWKVIERFTWNDLNTLGLYTKHTHTHANRHTHT